MLAITKKGTLTARKAGQTKITCKIGSKKKTITVIVKKTAAKKSDIPSQSEPEDSRESNAEPAPAADSSSSTDATYVYISATGGKYHKKNNCGTMNPDKATKLTVTEAEEKGYTPCKICFK